MIPAPLDYNSELVQLFPEVGPDGVPKKVMTFTFQVTTDCSLCCTYCYQTHKGHEMMSWDTAKRAIDYILEEAKKPDSVLSYDKILGLVIDFIGGEPLLNIDLVIQIIEYFELRLLEENSPWLFKHRYCFSSNGVAYFDPKVQDMLSKYSDLISMGITVDGHKALHDKCRVFPDGRGSYDYAIAAALAEKRKFDGESTKITLCPDNIMETANAIINMLSLGFHYIFANCVFEEGWEIEHARILYQQMKIISDYILDNNLEDKCGVSLFQQDSFCPLTDADTNNWCGGTGSMLAIDYKGDIFPCIRYMESSIGTEQKPLIIGNIYQGGAYVTPEHQKVYQELIAITRQSQSTQECIDCPIAKGCAWCSGYNYQKFGTVNKRATYICIMHKARAIGNYYYWKKEALKKNIPCAFELYLPMEEIISIIGQEEWQLLSNL